MQTFELSTLLYEEPSLPLTSDLEPLLWVSVASSVDTVMACITVSVIYLCIRP